MRKINKKILYVVMALAMLALLIPAMAVPVSAANGPLAVYLLAPFGPNPTAPGTGGLVLEPTNGDPPGAFNITGSTIRVVPTTLDAGVTVIDWVVNNYPLSNPGASIFSSDPGAVGVAYADVTGTVGHASIIAYLSDGSHLSVDKKWAQISETVIDVPQSIPVTWNESAKSFFATANVTDTVWGNFVNKDLAVEHHVMAGAILHWYLIDGNAVSNISLTPGYFDTVNGYISGLPPAIFTTFTGDNSGTSANTTSGVDGTSTVSINATGEGPVDVVIVPEYPSTDNVLVTPEITKINFWTQEMEKVPQVRWAGEKIILEKNWGVDPFSTNSDYAVKFSLELQSVGMLGAVGPPLTSSNHFSNLGNTTLTVWAPVDPNGLSSVLVESQDQGVATVTATLYRWDGDMQVVENQHGFVVYFLKLESLTLHNVSGKRANEDSGLFDNPNPWNNAVSPNGTDDTTGIVNVSTDTLLRATVKGWFTNGNPSLRDPGWVDMNGNGIKDPTDLLLPGGRWILPDDWPYLAGYDPNGANWQENRLHWDIMDNPFDGVMSRWNDPTTDNAYAGITTPRTPVSSPAADMEGNWGTGNYYMYPSVTSVTGGGNLVAAAPVIGPFSPGIELMTPIGWVVKNVASPTWAPLQFGPDPQRQMSTVVPNGTLDMWDAPMPPAKITFEINSHHDLVDSPTASDPTFPQIDVGNAGYFKTAMKTDIYYTMIGGVKYYTAPFYQEMIPAHEWIPAMINNGGYDWASFNMTQYGPYPFWYIMNRPTNLQVPTANADYPTKVQVYSDNHGEAMVFLNGDWNLNQMLWTPNGLNIGFGDTVGQSVVQAMADYPYQREHQAIWSNTVTKTWVWGGRTFNDMVLTVGDYVITSGTAPKENGKSAKRLVFVWATDRDGRIDGVLNTQVVWMISGGALINFSESTHIASNYPTTPPVMPLIHITNGFLDVAPGVLLGSMDGTMGKSWLKTPNAAEKLLFTKFYNGLFDPNDFAVAAIEIIDGSQKTDNTVTVQLSGPDFGSTTLQYVQNVNFNSGSPLDDNILRGDANVDGSVNVGDVNAAERMILGLNSTPNVQADANNDGGIDMGDVVGIERTILGYK